MISSELYHWYIFLSILSTTSVVLEVLSEIFLSKYIRYIYNATNRGILLTVLVMSWIPVMNIGILIHSCIDIFDRWVQAFDLKDWLEKPIIKIEPWY